MNGHINRDGSSTHTCLLIAACRSFSWPCWIWTTPSGKISWSSAFLLRSCGSISQLWFFWSWGTVIKICVLFCSCRRTQLSNTASIDRSLLFPLWIYRSAMGFSQGGTSAGFRSTPSRSIYWRVWRSDRRSYCWRWWNWPIRGIRTPYHW